MRTKTFDEATVLHGAMILFWEKGFESTSIAELEEKTGLVRTSLYHFYGSKEGVFLRALDVYIDQQCAAWLAILQSSAPVLTVLDTFFDAIIAHNIDDKTPTSCMIAVNSIAIDRMSPLVRQKLLHGYQGMIAALEQLFQRGVANKELNPALDPHALAIHMMGSIQGIMLLSRVLNNEVDFQPTKRQSLDYVRTLLLPS